MVVAVVGVVAGNSVVDGSEPDMAAGKGLLDLAEVVAGNTVVAGVEPDMAADIVAVDTG